jgi:hypothetical protein
MSATHIVSPRRLITVLIAVLALVVGGSAVALSVTPAPTTVQATGANLTRFIYASDGNPAQITNFTNFADVPGMTTTITVPAGTKAVIAARFSATSICVGTPVILNASCFVRILIGGVEGKPNGVNLSVFDSTRNVEPNVFEGFDVGQQAHMIERVRGPVGPGTYVVKVQSFVPYQGATLALINWMLEVQRFKV